MARGFEGEPIRQSTFYVHLHERKVLGEAYHWGLVLTDVQGEGATKYHCTDRSGKWGYKVERLDILVPTADTVCLAGLGSIPEEKRADAEKILGKVEVMPVDSKVASGEPFNCRTWLNMVIHQLDRARIIRLISDVDYLETNTRLLAGRIVAQRSTGGVPPMVFDRAWPSRMTLIKQI